MLSHIVGQPPVRHLAAYVQAVKAGKATSKCYLLEGPPGIGKSASAQAVADELGCHDGFGGGLTKVNCAQFGVKDSELLIRDLGFSVCTALRWRVVILDEFERLSRECQVNLKYHLGEENIPSRTCVIATSNHAAGLDKALLDRFKRMPYSAGESFAQACRERLEALWQSAMGAVDLPMGYTIWGREENGFSMRSALASLEEAQAERELMAA